jgi:four helix bundle protein
MKNRVGRFEELVAWQKARELRTHVYRVSRLQPFERDFEMRNQIRGAALSVMSNIAEGFERNRNTEFLYFLRVARASCGEVQSQLYAAFDEGYLHENALRDLLDRAAEVSRIIRGLQNSIERNQALGTRH